MDFFQFKCLPFAITPDPEFLYLSETHRHAIEKIAYGIQSRQGFMLLTGEVGTGKSTLCRVLLDSLQNDAQTVYVINPSLSGRELLATILDDLGVARAEEASKKTLIDQLNAYLLSRSLSQPVVIIIDDAQTMSAETLEDMRLLSNLETDKDKLLQVLLVGQPELLTQIEQPNMRQLRQRIAVNCALSFLKLDEVGCYIERRLFVAGNHGQTRFTPRLVRQIHKQSKGVPRLINKICDLALTAAYTADSCTVDTRHLKAARDEIVDLTRVDGEQKPLGGQGRRRAALTIAAAVGLILAMALGFGAYPLLKRTTDQGSATLHAPMAARPSASLPVASQALPAVATEDPIPVFPAFAQAGDTTGAYILQLGSYKTLKTTQRAIDIYARKEIPAYWVDLPGEDGTVWYRVYTGRFASKQAARDYRQVHGLNRAIIRHAPWTVAVGGAGSSEQIAVLRELLKVYRLDGYRVPGEGGQWHLLSGAFLSRQGAEAMADQIHRQTGLSTRIADLNGDPTPHRRPPDTAARNRSS
jgi:general secretion pathway protein A